VNNFFSSSFLLDFGFGFFSDKIFDGQFFFFNLIFLPFTHLFLRGTYFFICLTELGTMVLARRAIGHLSPMFLDIFDFTEF
jgi:hypothetical protein